MQLFSLAVAGPTKEMTSGKFEEKTLKRETWNAMGLLTAKDNMFRNQNSKKNASNLLHACRKFKDKSLSSFLPSFRTLLARSPMSNTEDAHKLHLIENSFNKVTRKFLIRKNLLDNFSAYIEYLNVLGS